MLKQLFLTLAILISVTGFMSCSKDEPNNGGKDPIENPTDDPKDDPTDDPKDDPADDGTVTVNADGSTSNGMPFRRIDETNFMLNYVQYWIKDGHLEVVGHDKIEVVASLKGKVTIVPAVTIDGSKYYTRVIDGFIESSIKEIELPNTVTKIGNWAFRLSQSLEKVSIPESLKSIGSQAFAGCTSLSSIELNEGLETLGQQAFLGCTKLETISIPENVCIYGGCFNGVPLKELRLPESFKINASTGDGYVFNSTYLENIYVKSKDAKEPIGDQTLLFDDFLRYSADLNVPEGSRNSYAKSKFWGKFKFIKEYNPE